MLYKAKAWYVSFGAFFLSLWAIIGDIFLSASIVIFPFTAFAIDGITIMYFISKNLSERITRTNLYSEIVKNSFGIYLFHPMIIYIIYYSIGSLSVWPINPIITSLLVFCVSVLMSVLLTILVRRIHLSLIIGE